jgi:hypothetical protein
MSTGPPGAGDVERLLDDVRQLLKALDEVVVFRDRQRDAGDVGFLEGVLTDKLAGDLTGDRHDRRGVHHRGGQPGD